jgi:hypothetical protein
VVALRQMISTGGSPSSGIGESCMRAAGRSDVPSVPHTTAVQPQLKKRTDALDPPLKRLTVDDNQPSEV